MAQSGNRPPRKGQSPKAGDRPPRSDRATTNGAPGESAAERARERLAQQNASGQKRQSASQRARATAPATQRGRAGGSATQRDRTGTPAPQRSRTGGAASRRGSARGAKKRSTALTAGIFGTVFVVLAVLVIILVAVVGKTPSGAKAFGTQPAPQIVKSAINSTPAAAFIDAGSKLTSDGPFLGSIYSLKGQPRLTLNGKPLIVYVGSEWCPFCGATRWPLALALGRFGTFSGLKISASSLTDSYPGTPTLSFYGSTYTSKYLAFSGIEQCTDIPSSSSSLAVRECSGYVPLQTITSAVAKIFDKYDYPPYVPSSGTDPGGIPFIDFGNLYHEDGAFIDPAILTGFTHARVVESFSNPVASPAQMILVAANYYSALICKMTNNQPGSVCNMPVVKQAAATLKL